MKNKFIKLSAIIITVLGITGLITLPTYATECDNICTCPEASDAIKAASGCGGSTTSIEDTIMNIINGVLGILATVAVVVIVIAGVQYMTSAGDGAKVKKAKDTILYACIGLIIIILAAVIVNFVIDIIPKNP